MSIVDEVMEPGGVGQDTVFVNGVLTSVPRTVVKPVLAELSVAITTIPGDESHYAVGDSKGVPYVMFFAKPGLCLVDVLAMAYRNLFLWIRPQGANKVYYDPYSDRDTALGSIKRGIFELVGKSPEGMYANYHDRRQLTIVDEPHTYDLVRTYDKVKDSITTIVMELPCEIAAYDEVQDSAPITTYRTGPAWTDPGDFIPGVWTPDPNFDASPKPVDEPHPDNVPK